MSSHPLNTVTIDLAALAGNYQAIQQKVGSGVRILAMVKSDAYGHGMIQSAQKLAEAGCQYFGVAEIDEGIALREAGLAGEIIVFLGSYHYQEILHYDLSPVVFDLQMLEGLSAKAVEANKQIGVHLKIDVGMGRLGIMPKQVPDFLKRIEALPGVFLASILGHFPSADINEARESTMVQGRRFAELSGVCSDQHSEAALLHIANSAAILRYPATYYSMVRPGIALYGCYPAPECENSSPVSLRPVMSFSSRIIQVKEVPTGYGLSYGHLHLTHRPTRLAVLPVGYADGYLRALTGKAQVLIRGQRTKVLGRICMNACVADITDIPEARVDDPVQLMGCQAAGHKENDQLISADEVADWLGTISYEVLCLFGNSNERIYI